MCNLSLTKEQSIWDDLGLSKEMSILGSEHIKLGRINNIIKNTQQVLTVYCHHGSEITQANNLTVSNWQTEIRPITNLPYVGLENGNLLPYGYTGEPNAYFYVDNVAPNIIATTDEPRTVRLDNFYNRNSYLASRRISADIIHFYGVTNSDLLFLGNFMHFTESNIRFRIGLLDRVSRLSSFFYQMPSHELDLNINTLANIANFSRGRIIDFPYVRIIDLATLHFLIIGRIQITGVTYQIQITDVRRQDILDMIRIHRNR